MSIVLVFSLAVVAVALIAGTVICVKYIVDAWVRVKEIETGIYSDSEESEE